MAVQVVAYEILRARLGPEALPAPAQQREVPLADAQAMERLYGHLGRVLELVDFRDRTQAGTHLMNRFRRLLQRAELDGNEVNILRGLLTAVEQRRRRAGDAAPGSSRGPGETEQP
jgi:tRNA C32,U32 (ribose-2'-O)-methylase TrmJ